MVTTHKTFTSKVKTFLLRCNTWKFVWIIMINNRHKAISYRPISMLSIMSETIEWLLHKRITEDPEIHLVISTLQFSFQKAYYAIQQCHRIVENIHASLKEKKICAFYRVWHDGLLYKFKSFLPTPCYLLFKSYFTYL